MSATLKRKHREHHTELGMYKEMLEKVSVP